MISIKYRGAAGGMLEPPDKGPCLMNEMREARTLTPPARAASLDSVGSRLRLLIVWVLLAAFAVGVPAATLEATLAMQCPAAAQADDCCGGASADSGCAAHCAASCAPVLVPVAPTLAAQPRAALAIAFAPRARGLPARAPDAAPPRPILA